MCHNFFFGTKIVFLLTYIISIMKKKIQLLSLIFVIVFSQVNAQYQPQNTSNQDIQKANQWVENTYKNLSQDEKLGQLFIIALYTNKDENHINKVRNIIRQEKIGGLILMQDDAKREIQLLNEFQNQVKVPLLIGMDAEWGLYQRIKKAHKFPWAMTLGAIQDKSLIYKMSSQIAKDAKAMGVNWDFAPVVDVNTNPKNPIIGNRSFGSEVENVVASASAYANGLQDHNVLAAIKHFPGHGDTDTDSHLDLPAVTHSLERLNKVELAPFKMMMNKGIGGVMVAHLYVPALEKRKNVPASVSKTIITGLLKNKLGYKGLIITDALNMGAVAKRYKAGELDALAFKAGNDIMLFSKGVKEGKRLIQKAIDNGEISQKRVEESVKKILLTKYYLGLSSYTPRDAQSINAQINTPKHDALSQELYANALTLLKDEKQLLPLDCNEKIYYIPMEEAPYSDFLDTLNLGTTVIVKKPSEMASIPAHSKVIVGFHKDNSTAYKSYKIAYASKKWLKNLSQKHDVILSVFGSPYALKDVDIQNVSTVLVAYENNKNSLKSTTNALLGKTEIHGRLPVIINSKLKAGAGINLTTKTTIIVE